MRLLIPDMTKPQRPDFIYCLPIDKTTWQQLVFVMPIPHGERVHYGYVRVSGRDGDNRVVIILQNGDDDACMELAARLRLVEDFNGPIYLLPWSDHPPDPLNIVTHHMGTDPLAILSLDSLTTD